MITNETRIDKQVCSYCNQGFLDCNCAEFHPNKFDPTPIEVPAELGVSRFDNETAKQLINFLSNQYISHNDYPLVYKLIHDLQEYLK